jgi:hypothetical protein
MPDVALYYPYTHVRDDAWLKAAALYWPKLAVLVPTNYPRRDTAVAAALREELDFFVDVDPAFRAREVADEFIGVVFRKRDALRARYGQIGSLPAELIARARVVASGSGPATPLISGLTLAWLSRRKLSPSLTEKFLDTGLGVLSDDRAWMGVDPQLADVYLAALAERVARANGMPLVTDQPRAHGALNGWDVETLARVLLAGDADDMPAAREPDGIAALYAAVAISTVVPRGLADVPVKRIIAARRMLADEFDSFREHLDSMAERFTELAEIESPEVLRARLKILVERDLRRPTATLEAGLRQLGMEPARAVLGMNSLALPATAAAVAAGAGVPVAVGQAGMVAARFIGSGLRARRSSREMRRSAAGYLLGLRLELDPRGIVERVRRTIRHAAFRSEGVARRRRR